MTSLHPSLRNLLLCIAVLGIGAACSGSEGFSPTAPSAPSLTIATGNSVLSGVVEIDGAGGSAPSTDVGGIRVILEGTGISDRTGHDGRFRLVGVPEGTAGLRFRRDSLDTRVDVPGIASDSHVNIQVMLAPEGARVLQSDQEDLVEFEGLAIAVDLGARTLTLDDGRTVLVEEPPSTTWDDDGDLDSLEAVAAALDRGSTVEVEGTAAEEEGVLVATSIKAQEEEVEPVEVEGRITGVDPTAGSFDVDGVGTVLVDSETVWEPSDVDTLEELETLVDAGNMAFADGEALPDGDDLVATRMQIEVEEIEFESGVDSVDVTADRLLLHDGSRVQVDAETSWSGDALSVQAVADALADGASVEVEGEGLLLSDGAILASSLRTDVEEPEDDGDDDSDDDSEEDGDDDSEDDDSDEAVDFSDEIDAIEDLADETDEAAEEAGLNGGQTNSLIVSLDQAIASLQRGNGQAAANQLGAFVNKVEAMINSGRMDEEDAEELIEEAEEIQDDIRAKL